MTITTSTTNKMDQELKKKGKHLKPMVRVGKSGITDSLIDEIDKHLKKRKLVKIKFLKNSIDTNVQDMASSIAEKTSSELLMVIGLTAVFSRKRK